MWNFQKTEGHNLNNEELAIIDNSHMIGFFRNKNNMIISFVSIFNFFIYTFPLGIYPDNLLISSKPAFGNLLKVYPLENRFENYNLDNQVISTKPFELFNLY